MALAWKAGWVNSPQGFESPILRHADQRRRRDGLDEPDPAFGLWSRFSSRYRGDDRPGHPLDAETPSKAGWGTSPRFARTTRMITSVSACGWSTFLWSRTSSAVEASHGAQETVSPADLLWLA